MQDFGTKADNSPPPGGQLSAAEFNNLATELENSVLRSGQTLSGASVLQMATSLFLHGAKAQTFQDSGVANAYVATPVSGSSGVTLPSDYTAMDGVIVMFKASNANTTASTLNIGQTTGTLLGTKAIVSQSGTALSAQAILAGSYVQVRYDASIGSGSWVILPWAESDFFAHGIAVFSTAGVSSWTVPDGVIRADIICIGGGGGGGGAGATAAGQLAVGGGGGAGGFSQKIVDLTGVSSVSVTVGAAGAAGVGGVSNGGNGGTSSFGAFVSSTGGSGGINLAAGTTATFSQGGAAGSGSSGDVNARGGAGHPSLRLTGNDGHSGAGGDSYFGGGGPSTYTQSAGTAGLLGSGGSGSLSINGGAATNGGAGGAGIVVVRW